MKLCKCYYRLCQSNHAALSITDEHHIVTQHQVEQIYLRKGADVIPVLLHEEVVPTRPVRQYSLRSLNFEDSVSTSPPPHSADTGNETDLA